MLLALKIILAGLLTSLVVYLANTGSTKLAGLMISFPIVLMSSTFVIGNTAGTEAARAVVKSNLIAMPIWLVSICCLLLALKYLPYLPAVAIGLGAWFAAAIVYLR